MNVHSVGPPPGRAWTQRPRQVKRKRMRLTHIEPEFARLSARTSCMR
jgi:hypothetical protein